MNVTELKEKLIAIKEAKKSEPPYLSDESKLALYRIGLLDDEYDSIVDDSYYDGDALAFAIKALTLCENKMEEKK
jgi:hypothetical protein